MSDQIQTEADNYLQPHSQDQVIENGKKTPQIKSKNQSPKKTPQSKSNQQSPPKVPSQKNSPKVVSQQQSPQKQTLSMQIETEVQQPQSNKKEQNGQSQKSPQKSPQKIISNDNQSQQNSLSKVYNYGSTEMDQFWLPDQRSETRRPYLCSLLPNVQIIQICCGSLHIIMLSSEGNVYSSGQNDDGALGRPDESESDPESDKKPKLVPLPIKVDIISAGDSHSVAANSLTGAVYLWGTYRNTEKANLAPPAREPTLTGQKEFNKKPLKQVLSGAQHTLVLTKSGEVYAWGDPDMGVVGRMPKTRHAYEMALRVAKITSFKVEQIYTGGRHSFLRRQVKNQNSYYSWGLNNFGQLGLDLPPEKNQEVVFEVTEMKFFKDKNVKNITGGESHSLVLLEDGTLYGFGRNDIGQLALGEVKENHEQYGEIKEDYKGPVLIDTFGEYQGKLEQIWSGPNYNYARCNDGQIFSWGFGSNFVLGNRKDEDEDEYKPFKVPRDFFKDEVPREFGLGAQHVSYFVNNFKGELKVDQSLLTPQVEKKSENKRGKSTQKHTEEEKQQDGNQEEKNSGKIKILKREKNEQKQEQKNLQNDEKRKQEESKQKAVKIVKPQKIKNEDDQENVIQKKSTQKGKKQTTKKSKK